MKRIVVFLLPLVLFACAEEPPKPVPVTAPPIYQRSLPQWLESVKHEALQQGIRPQIVDVAFRDFQPIPRVIELDRKQPEGTMTYTQYKQNTIPPSRVSKARAMLQQHGPLLQQISARYGVQPQYIVALWGVETDFGANMGRFPVIHALATLAYDGRRSDFFRSELLKALHILNQGHIRFSDMQGSWAGAMGQSQFMPSSFLNFAVDHDGDGRKDIWGTTPDVFASIANYLSQSGWRGNERWGEAVILTKPLPEAVQSSEQSIAKWQEMGVQLMPGTRQTALGALAKLVTPGTPEEGSFLVYSNYQTLLKWNRSSYFATSVGLLADAIAGP